MGLDHRPDRRLDRALHLRRHPRDVRPGPLRPHAGHLTSPGRTHRLVVDTDLGSDVDDALALALLLGSPEVSLVAVTTVYGDTLLRARMVAQLTRLAGTPVPVVPGSAVPLSGRPVWLSGEEELGWRDLAAEPLPPAGEEGAAEWLVAAAREAPGTLEILAIGPLTNLARALRLHPGFADDVAHVWVMGGCFDGGIDAEHNFVSDAVAAAEVFASRLPVTVTGVEVTRLVRLDETQVRSFGGGPLGDLLVAQTLAWMRYWSEPYDVPHDALTALVILRPDLFSSAPASITVDEVSGVSVATSGTGAQRLVTAVDVPAATAEILARIRRAVQAVRS